MLFNFKSIYTKWQSQATQKLLRILLILSFYNSCLIQRHLIQYSLNLKSLQTKRGFRFNQSSLTKSQDSVSRIRLGSRKTASGRMSGT